MEFRELLGLGKELRALLIPVFVGMRLRKELEFSLGWFLGKFRLPDPADSRFFLWKLPWKSWEENPTGSWNVWVGKARSSSHSMGDSRSSQPHPSRISLELPLEFRQEKGFGSWELLIPGSFPALFPGIAHSQLIPSPFPGNCSFPALIPGFGDSRARCAL